MPRLLHTRCFYPWQHLILSFMLLSFFCAISLGSEEILKKDALEQPEYVAELRQSTVVVGANDTDTELPKPNRPCRGGDLSREKKKLLKRLRMPKKAERYTPHHIRYRLLSAIDGFQKYGERAEGGIQAKRQMFQDMGTEQAEFINRVVSYQEKFAAVSEGINRNARVAESIATYALGYYHIDQSEVDAHARQLASEGRSSDHTSVSQALKHFVRDWSHDGAEEREAVFPQILETLKELFPERSDENPTSVLIPGSGVGGLAHFVDDLTGFDVTSNEYSSYMNIAYRYITHLRTANSESIQPYVDGWSHQPTTSELLRSISFPQVPVTLERVVHVEGDFTVAFSKLHGTFDVVVTLFFIDTARNLLTYFETIRALLKPGGVWINLGPLLYGSRPMVELSVDEIVAVVEEMGFIFQETDEKWGDLTLEGKMVRGKEARYGLNPRVLTKNSYHAQFWVAKKLEA